MRILIIDDDEDTSILLETILRSEGYIYIDTMNSGHEALSMMGFGDAPPQTAQPDLILLDVLMPVMDGIETCSRLKSIPVLQDVPIIMVTGMSDDEVLKQSFDAGASDYITKPFKKVELLVRIRSALRLKSEIDRRKEREAELLRVTSLLEDAVLNLRQVSLTDGLTALTNRRGFDENWAREFERLMQGQADASLDDALSLVLLDVDQFKQYNDIYGHVEGDRCLQRVAEVLRRETKQPGVLAARYGGEEFVLLLPGTTSEAAVATAERVRTGVEGLRIEHSQSKVSSFVTISLGVVSIRPADDTSMSAVIAAADQALYEAKAAGRNRAQVYASPLKFH
ncbi:diguanylate cyclase [Paenibacillus cremeus]|uniref:Diguanylate cyclase n=1 Tax=Paenibacillus cremeus TaxID=2163881 RepID=A0A559K652_9BACL|nr:diguanylate cyclase [Paenibacillus cremeus]TVY07612.1 diguanylate cyclase [Paenibacillus cremeus]